MGWDGQGLGVRGVCELKREEGWKGGMERG